MSTKCIFRVLQSVKEHKTTNGQTITNEKTRVCGRDVSVFLRIEYSELYIHHARDGKFYDVFGFCPEHGEAINTHPEKLGSRYAAGSIHGIRGSVKAVSLVDMAEVQDPKALSRLEDKLRLMAGVKGNIKRLMGQRNTRKLSVDDWRQICEEAIDEFTVESVMNS
jgi:hypothetical protein